MQKDRNRKERKRNSPGLDCSRDARFDERNSSLVLRDADCFRAFFCNAILDSEKEEYEFAELVENAARDALVKRGWNLCEPNFRAW